jgi:hypothetical protein
MAWINTTSPGASYQGIIVKQLAYSLFLASDILTYYDWSLSTAVSTGLNLADGNWHFVAISFQSGVSSGTVVYVDGSPVLTSIMTISSQSNPLGIGTGEAGSGQNITGTIAQAAVFGSILAATTINNLWQVANGHYSSPTSLFFPFLGS